MSFAFGAADAFNSLMYGQPHPGTVQYLKNQFEHASSYIQEAGTSFLEKSRQMFEHFHSDSAINFARSIVQQVTGLGSVPDIIRPLVTAEELQKAMIGMQRWVMACPEVRQLYHNQRIDGYSTTYVDGYPNAIGDSHYDYRRVMDGLVEFDEDGQWHCTNYLDELNNDDRELTLSEQVAIIQTWNAAKTLIALGSDDFTEN